MWTRYVLLFWHRRCQAGGFPQALGKEQTFLSGDASKLSSEFSDCQGSLRTAHSRKLVPKTVPGSWHVFWHQSPKSPVDGPFGEGLCGEIARDDLACRKRSCFPLPAKRSCSKILLAPVGRAVGAPSGLLFRN